ncbi:MAG TPA: two-component regulator propeller domain-containing protein [Ignavibacteria bacterium]|jgi:ligand-binding sensor domain-containing protein
MLKKICSILLFSSAIVIFSQNTQNGWNIYTSMRDVSSVGLLGNSVWAASSGGLFTFDESSPSNITKFTTLEGLLSNELNTNIVDLNGNIWGGAFDGSISVYYPSNKTWRGITDIRNSNESSKRINHFFQYGNFMFFATEFCIVKFSISQFQFVDQPYIFLGPLLSPKTPVNWIHVVNDTIWAATDDGIAYANINSGLPIQTNWHNFKTVNSVLNRNLINTIAYFGNKVFFGTDSGMVYFQNGTLTKFEPLFNGNPLREAYGDMIAAGNGLYFSSYRYSDRIYRVDISNLGVATEVYSGNPVNNFKVESNGNLVVATKYRGIDIYRNSTHTSIYPNGPYSNLIFNMAVDNNSNLWAVSGSLGNWENESGIYKLEGTTWKNYILAQYPQMGPGCCGYVQVYSSRNGRDVWVSGFGLGLLNINGDSLTRYTDANSILCFFENSGFVLVEGIKEDNNGNLWLINRACIKPIVNYTTGQAYQGPTTSASNTLLYMAIDNYNTKWMTLAPNIGEQGVVYFNENIPSGNIIRTNQLGADIQSVNNIVADKNGEIWIATNNGISIVPDPSQVINTPNSIPFTHKMNIIEDSLSTPLTENVSAIGVDAINNKWIGTNSNGLLYVSPDGSTLLARYTVLNSPLPDNKITSIVCDNNKGTVYFGTAKGVVSLGTIAISPLENCDKISVGPNPFLVPPDKPLRIDGLVAESTVKILSISGMLIAEFETPGGRVTNWDGKDLYGNYVSSGIYIIVGFNKDGSQACTGKVAVVRK